jgi:hypothetical protein
MACCTAVIGGKHAHHRAGVVPRNPQRRVQHGRRGVAGGRFHQQVLQRHVGQLFQDLRAVVVASDHHQALGFAAQRHQPVTGGLQQAAPRVVQGQELFGTVAARQRPEAFAAAARQDHRDKRRARCLGGIGG